MLVILAISIFAALSFRREALAKGYASGRFVMFPLIVGGVLVSLSQVVILIGGRVLNEGPLFELLPWVVTVMAIVMHGFVISRMWKQVKGLPQGEGK